MLLGKRRLFIAFIPWTVDNYGGDIKMIATAVYKEGNDKNLMNKYPYRKTVWEGDNHVLSAWKPKSESGD